MRGRLKSDRSGFDSSGIHHAPVGQLAESPGLGPGCWGFESLQVYQFRVPKVDSFGSRSVKPILRGVERNHRGPPV